MLGSAAFHGGHDDVERGGGGASAAREAIRTEGALWLDAAEREAADRAEAARAAAAPFDVVMAAVERR